MAYSVDEEGGECRPLFVGKRGDLACWILVGTGVADMGEEGTGGAGEGEAMGRSGYREASHSGCPKQCDEMERMG